VIANKNRFFLNDPAGHAQIFVDDPFHRTGGHLCSAASFRIDFFGSLHMPVVTRPMAVTVRFCLWASNPNNLQVIASL
jgi:hypothetical protein